MVGILLTSHHTSTGLGRYVKIRTMLWFLYEVYLGLECIEICTCTSLFSHTLRTSSLETRKKKG